MSQNTGPLLNIDDAISRMPRYTQEAVDSANVVDDTVAELCKPTRLPFKIVWRWQLDQLRDKTYHLLNRTVTIGVAWRIIAHHRKLDRE